MKNLQTGSMLVYVVQWPLYEEFQVLVGVCMPLWQIKVHVKKMCFAGGSPRCCESFVLLLPSGCGARCLMKLNSVLFRVTMVSSFASVTALQGEAYKSHRFYSSLVTLP